MSSQRPRSITLDDGETIAYHHTPGKSPGVVFLTGLKSDMTGGKALALESFCKARSQAYLRFDYFGHGKSSGDFIDGRIGRWAADAVFVIDRLIEGPVVLVGSSMGGWIMLLAALARKNRVSGLLGVAPAPDFTVDLMERTFTGDQKRELAETGRVVVPNCHEDSDGYEIGAAFLEEARNHLLLRAPIDLACPIRLVHGMKDEDVPWNTSLEIQKRLASRDVEVTLIKSGGHRLSTEADLDGLARILDRLLSQLEARNQGCGDHI